MYLLCLVTPAISAEEPQDFVSAPGAVPDFLPPKEITAADPISVRDGMAEKLFDFLRQFRRHPLVAVQNEHPFMRGLWNDPILLRGWIDVIVFQHAAGQWPRNLNCL